MPTWFDQVLAPSEGNDYRAWTDQFREMNPTSGGAYPTQIPQQGGQDYQALFQQIMGGLPATPENLIAKEAELRAAGIEVRRNAAGTAGKIGIIGQPDQIYDVIANAEGGGGGPWQWNAAPPGGAMRGGSQPLGAIAGGANYAARLPALEQTPGYQFRLGQGMDAVQKSAAAKGTLLSGGTLKDLTEFAQGLASTEFGNEFGRNASLADLGLRAAGAQGAYGTAYGDQLTDLTTGAGNARAAGTAAAGNAWGGTLQGLGSLGMQAGLYNWLNPSQPNPQNNLGVMGDYRVRWLY